MNSIWNQYIDVWVIEKLCIFLLIEVSNEWKRHYNDFPFKLKFNFAEKNLINEQLLVNSHYMEIISNKGNRQS